MLSTILSVALGFILGVLVLALVAWFAFSRLGFRIVQGNIGTILPTPPQYKPPAPRAQTSAPPLSRSVPRTVPSRSGSSPLSRLRVDLFIGKDRIPLVYTLELPVAQLATARPTMSDASIGSYDRGGELPVDPIDPFTLDDVMAVKTIMVGREGHVRPELLGFGMMPRILFEITVRDQTSFIITARKDVKDHGMLQVKVGTGEPKSMKSQELNLRVSGVTEIRQEEPSYRGPKISTWHFKISLCD